MLSRIVAQENPTFLNRWSIIRPVRTYCDIIAKEVYCPCDSEVLFVGRDTEGYYSVLLQICADVIVNIEHLVSVDVSVGFAFQASDLVASTIGFIPSSREAASLALCIPLSGPLSTRMSVFYSRDVWKRFVGSVNKFSYYFGLRGEVMFDPMYYFKDIRKYISIPLFMGPEYGYMLKYDHSS